MINLIPNEEKKKMRWNFYLRFMTVLFFSLGFSMIFVIVATLPSYVLLSAREGVVNETVEKQKNEPLPEASKRVLAVAEELNIKLGIISGAQQKEFLVSEKIINELVLNKMSDIKLSGIAYEMNAEGEKKVRIRGTASSRERLVLFRRALEESLAFQQIDLPISNFVKGSNIEFSLTLVPS